MPTVGEAKRWTPEQLNAATEIAASAWRWKEFATAQEVTATCAMIEKHAHLFAADPLKAELVERLEQLVAYAASREAEFQHHCPERKGPMDATMKNALEQARAALARAREGEKHG